MDNIHFKVCMSCARVKRKKAFSIELGIYDTSHI